MAISMLNIRRPLGRLIFNMGIAIPGKTVFLIETAPWVNIGSGYGLLPNTTKPLSEPILISHLGWSEALTREQSHNECPSCYSVLG